MMVQYYVGDDIFVVCESEAHRDFVRRYQELTGASHTYIDSYAEARLAGLPSKALIMTDEPDKVAAMALEYFKHQGIDESRTAKVIPGSPPFFVEFLHPNVCKGNGLLKLCDMVGVTPEATIAMGDGDNDAEFLQFAGLGIAMLNARDRVKACADKVSLKTNCEDGVVFELEWLRDAGELSMPSK
mmetsp:Transcript_20071/g.46470  ORF Transcript_20071/g.46470 Transcript_20071/m.46470 type:complete len:185 (+) Transcript_20071:496-1050(+)